MKSPLTSEVRSLRRALAQQSLWAFTKTYLAEHIKHAPSAAHQELYGLLTDALTRRGQWMAIAAPRGFGKSTLVTLAYVLYGICYGQERFIVILSATASQAMQLLESIKRELTGNAKLLMDFSELAGPSPRPWTRADIVTPTGIRVLALGSGQRIRGRKHGKDRPTLIIADDLENAENTFSLKSREQLKDWFNRSILKAGGEETNFLFLGTLHHPYCLLGEYVDPHAHPEWTKRVYKAICAWSAHPELWAQWAHLYNSQETWQQAYGPHAARAFYEANREAMDAGIQILWPQRWTYYDFMVKREEDPISFDSEYQNEPINPRDCLFNVEKLTYWDDEHASPEALLRALGEDVEFYGACDPSLGHDTTRGDYTAIVILAKSPKDGLLYVLVADLARRSPTETIDMIFAYYRPYRFTAFAIETNQFQELLAEEVERRGRELGQYLPIERVKHTTENKVRRIQSLHPWVTSGTIRFSRKHTSLLEQCRVFPKGKYDDGLDALEMAVRLAEQHSGGPSIRIINVNPNDTDPDDIPGWDVKWQSLE